MTSLRRWLLMVVVVLGACLGLAPASGEWPPAKAPVIPEADGYVVIPGAAVPPDASLTYRAIFDSNQGADAPDHLVPGLNMAGSELNAFGVAGVPMKNVKFVVVFHGRAMDGILDEAHYRAKFGVSNPNLLVIAKMKALGVEFYVCGQNLAGEKIDPATLTLDVKVAADALIVLMAYQTRGYALLSF